MSAAHTHLACPTALVEAPIDVVWGLLMNTAGWGQFYDGRVRQRCGLNLQVPPPPANGSSGIRDQDCFLSELRSTSLR